MSTVPVSSQSFKANINYDGSLPLLIFWIIFIFPIAFVLFFTKFSYQSGHRNINIAYNGSRFWLCFWTIFCFPVAIILALMNGFNVATSEWT